MTKLVAGRRIIRLGQVSAKTGLSAPTIWRHAAAGTFPKPIKISPGCSGWIEDEIDDLIEAKRLERDAAKSGVERSGGIMVDAAPASQAGCAHRPNVTATVTSGAALPPVRPAPAAVQKWLAAQHGARASDTGCSASGAAWHEHGSRCFRCQIGGQLERHPALHG